MRKVYASGEDQPSASFEEQYRRLFEAAECRTQKELAEVLDIRQSSVSGNKRRQSIPAEWRMKLFIKKRINPEWLLNGEGGKYLIPTDADLGKPQVVVTEIRPPQKCSAQDLVNELVRRAMKEKESVQREAADQRQRPETGGVEGILESIQGITRGDI